uniref:Uncharacterized protein n=1 Tax=Tanacetum cinerariifolium TaxID=118510 RepID=A0A699KIQ5_TANCI|nr:hypothetical protein [Tanacetum cinerariifolium]
MVYTGGDRQQVFASHAWMRLFGIRAPLLGGVRRMMTWRQFILALGLHIEKEIAEAGFGAYWDGSDSLIPDKGDLRDYWIEISSGRDFLGPAPEKVTGVDLFYLYSMDRRSANVSHLLAQYLFRQERGQVVTRELPLIDLHKLGRFNVYSRFGDTWAWVAPGPERQQAAADGTHEADKAGLAVDEGAQDILAPVQAPQPPPPHLSPGRCYRELIGSRRRCASYDRALWDYEELLRALLSSSLESPPR